MHGLSRRLNRIERNRGSRSCQCGGESRVVVVMGEDAPTPTACPRCGAEPSVVRLIRGVPPESRQIP